MGLRIEKSYDYQKKDNQKTTVTPAIAKVTKPVLRFAALENPNPTAAAAEEESDETSGETLTAAEESDETPTETTEKAAEPAQEEAEEATDASGRTYIFKPWKKLKEEYKELNQLSTDKERVIAWHKQNAQLNPKSYVIVDKANCEATAYSADGAVLETFEIGIGKQTGDEIQFENVDIRVENTKNGKKIVIEKAKDNKGKTFETTSAGIYHFLGKAKVGKTQYYNEYSITTERDSTGLSIKKMASTDPEAKKIGNKKLDDNRFTDGDVNLNIEDFYKMGKYLKPGTEIFVLPEDPNNKIVVRDGQLNFVQKEFTGTASTSKKPTVVHPIEIDLKPPKPENLGIGGTISKWTLKVPKRIAAWHYEDESLKTNYIKTLEDKKADMMTNLDIDNDTYNDLATLAIGIGNQETKLGQSPKYGWKKNWPSVVSAIKWLEGHTFWDVSPYDSRGMSQTKLDGYRDSYVKDLLDEKKGYGINPNNVDDPEKSAIATMIVLTSMYKNELPGIKSKLKELNMTWEDAMLYLWQGKKKSQILSGKANPDQNNYVRQVNSFLNRLTLKEVVEAPKIKQ